MIYFLVFLFLEIATTSFFAGMLGIFLTFVWTIVSIFLGIFIIKNFNLVIMYNINEIMAGNLDQEEFYKNNISKLIGALLLIIPGFFSDILGILFFSGLLNSFFVNMFSNKSSKNKGKKSATSTYTYTYTNTANGNTNTNANSDDIIDVEIIESIENNSKK